VIVVLYDVDIVLIFWVYCLFYVLVVKDNFSILVI